MTSAAWAESAVNLLANASFEGDGLGGVRDWNLRNAAKNSLIRLPGKGPDGLNAVRLVWTVQEYMEQHGIGMLESEEYEMSAKVRTHDLTGQLSLMFYNGGWWKEQHTPPFPKDTAGAWQTVSWRGKPMSSSNGKYTFCIAGSMNDGAQVEVSDIKLVPLTDKGKRESIAVQSTRPFEARLIPIDPLLSRINPEAGRILFYYPGDVVGDMADYEVVARVDAGSWCQAVQLGADRRACVSLGKLVPGKSYRLTAGVRRRGAPELISVNTYSMRADKVRPKGPVGKRLNNFVTELTRVREPDGEVRFVNPDDGWVYIGFTRPQPEAVVRLKGIVTPIVRPRPGEKSETMRYLPVGEVSLVVEGADEGSVLVVRSVKRIVSFAASVDSTPSSFSDWKWNADFTRKYLFKFGNTTEYYNCARVGDPATALRYAEFADRGIDSESVIHFVAQDPDRYDRDRAIRHLSENRSVREGFNVTIDESALGASSRLSKINFSESVWNVANNFSGAVNNFYCDATASVFADRRVQTSEIAAIVNSGSGTGMLYPEVYCSALADSKAAHRWEDHFIRFYESVTNFVPAARGHVLYYFGTFIEGGSGWSDWSSPEADIRVLYSDFIRRIATDPAYGDPGGIAAGYFYHAEDDVVRWLAKAVRYYAIEGGQEDLAAKYGLRYQLSHLSNCDFFDGLKGWSVFEGASGTVAAFRKEGYGRRWQGRQNAPEGTGDGVVSFTRTNIPNRIRQKIVGLEPGQHYAVTFYTCDRQEVDSAGSVMDDAFTLRATVSDGGTEVPELSYRRLAPPNRGWFLSKGEKRRRWIIGRTVFRAEGETAKLEFSDWAKDDEPGAPLGRENWMNFINVRKYYVESKAELEWLKRIGASDPRKPK